MLPLSALDSLRDGFADVRRSAAPSCGVFRAFRAGDPCAPFTLVGNGALYAKTFEIGFVKIAMEMGAGESVHDAESST